MTRLPIAARPRRLFTIIRSCALAAASLSAAHGQTLDIPHAGFSRVNNFNTGFGQLTWMEDTPSVESAAHVETVLDPIGYNGTGNRVLSLGFADNTPGARIRAAIPIPQIGQGEDGTTFFRIAFETTEQAGGFVGVGVNADPGLTRFEGVQAALINDDSGGMRYLNVDHDELLIDPSGLMNLTWYRFWILFDGSENTASIHVQGGPFEEQTLIASDVPLRPANPTADITHFVLEVESCQADCGDAITTRYIDDLYVHPGAHNLKNPVDPYPALEMGFTRTNNPPKVDGIKEADSYLKTFGITRVPHLSAEQVPPESFEDHSGTFSGAYTDEGLYLYIEVIDDIIMVDSISQPWNDDNIEILFDPDNRDNGRFDGVNDTKYVVTLLGDGTADISPGTYPVNAPGADWTGFESAYVETDYGYDVELFFPWSGLQIQPTGDWRLGMEIEINDDDDGGMRDGLLTIGSRDVPNHNTHQYPTIELWEPKTAVIAPLGEADSIIIDGIKDAVYASAPINRSTGRSSDSPAPPVGETYFTWQAVHDDSFLYLYVTIVDDDLSVDSPESPWNDDGLELFVDGNNSKGSGHATAGFDGIDDVKIVFRPQLDGTVAIDASSAFPITPPQADFTGLEAAYLQTDDGWNLELKVALATYGLGAQLAGKIIGFDLQLNDDDNGGDRDYTVTWSSGVDLNGRVDLWGNAQFFAPLHAQAARAEAAPTIDGHLDTAYSGAVWHPMIRTAADQALPSSNTLSGSWTALFDASDFYFMADIIDDDSSRGADGLILAFDGVRIAYWPNASQSARLVLEGGTADPNLRFAHQKTKLGYRVEGRIPARVFAPTTMLPATTRFDVWVKDADTGGEAELTLTWSAIDPASSNGEQLGTLAFAQESFASRIGAKTEDDGWFVSEWFGWFHELAANDGWIFHYGLGWNHVGAATGGADPLWIFNARLHAWMYTGETLFPYFWATADLGWAYYASYGPHAHLIYVYATDSWVDL